MMGNPEAGRRQTDIEPTTIFLRPGIRFPNWSVVSSETARQALEASLKVTRAEAKWSNLGEAEDRVRRAVLELYARLGRAPSAERIAEATGMSPDEVRTRMHGLRRRDMLVFDGEGETIAGAYPFSDRETGHRVALGRGILNAMCAIDALGAGSMLRADARVSSSCRKCGADIRIAVGKEGAALETVSPADTIVWSGIHYEDNAACSLCAVTAFFCSDEHLRLWRRENPLIQGFRLSVEEGLQVGRAIFSALLA